MRMMTVRKEEEEEAICTVTNCLDWILSKQKRNRFFPQLNVTVLKILHLKIGGKIRFFAQELTKIKRNGN